MNLPEENRPLRLGMVGGGQGAFIGAVHRIAARMDGKYVLVAGALSSDPGRAKTSAIELGIAPERSYVSYEEMAEKEAGRLDGIQAVSVVTPNHLHYPVSRAFLKAGIHVICDKPLTSDTQDAEKLAELVEQSDRLFFLTHNYSAYPMIRQAREMVGKGELGEIRLVQAEYPQDWLAEEIEQSGQKQAAWRTDPKFSGIGGAIGDIGTHAFHLGLFVSGLEAESLAADLDSFGKGRQLDDNAHIMLRYKTRENGKPAKGMIWASQMAIGHENGLKLRVYGTRGSLEWTQADPNYLLHTPLNQSCQTITRSGKGASAAAIAAARIPAGHPEGYLEAFANLYTEAAAAIRHFDKTNTLPKNCLVPDVRDGLTGMKFISACVESSRNNSAWVKI